MIVPRKELDGIAISASRVRKLLSEGDIEGVRPLVPDTTYNYLTSDEALPVLRKLRGDANGN